MGFIRRIREGIHRSTCNMKLGSMVNRRAAELRQRGLTKDQSEKQAEVELMQFLELWHPDLSSAADILFAEENFPIFTRKLDTTPPGEPEIMYLEEQFRLNPNDFKTAMALAGRYGILHRYDKAEEWFRHALEINPCSAEVYLGLGVTYMSQGRLDEAINLCKSAIELKPDSVEGHFHLALAYVALADATHVLAEEGILMRLDADRAKDLRKFIETLSP